MDSERLETQTPAGPAGPLDLAGTELVPVDRPQQLVPYDPLGGVGQYWCNWRPETRADKRRILRCFSEEGAKAGDILNTTIRITHVLIHAIELTDPESGEVFPAHRTVLVCDDDTTVSFVSQGIIKSLSLICMMEGKGPWNPPIAVRMRQLQLKSGRRMYTLDLVDEDTPSPTKGVKKNGR